MRVLGTIVRTFIVDVFRRQAEGSKCDVIGLKFIGRDPRWRPPELLQFGFPTYVEKCNEVAANNYEGFAVA